MIGTCHKTKYFLIKALSDKNKFIKHGPLKLLLLLVKSYFDQKK